MRALKSSIIVTSYLPFYDYNTSTSRSKRNPSQKSSHISSINGIYNGGYLRLLSSALSDLHPLALRTTRIQMQTRTVPPPGIKEVLHPIISNLQLVLD